MSTLKERSQAILDEKNAKILPENIKKDVQIFDIVGTMEEGIDTSDATAIANDLAEGKTAYVNGEKVTGTLRELNTEVNHVGKLIKTSTTGSGANAYHTLWFQGNTTKNSWGDKGFIARGNYIHTIGFKYAEVVSSLGITPDQIMSGHSILDVEGTATSDANATTSDIVNGKTAYVNGELVTGTVSEYIANSNGGLRTTEIEVGSNNTVKLIAPKDGLIRQGGYSWATGDIVADAIGLTSDKIVEGNTILGIDGNAKSAPDAQEYNDYYDTGVYSTAIDGENYLTFDMPAGSFTEPLYLDETSNLTLSAKEQDVANSIELTAEKLVVGNTILGIAGTAEIGGSGEIKLFETIEELQADETAQEGDLAIVYNTLQSSYARNDAISILYLPEIITLDTPYTDTSTTYFDLGSQCSIKTDRILYQISIMEDDMYCHFSLSYSSTDGKTYTRATDYNEPYGCTYENDYLELPRAMTLSYDGMGTDNTNRAIIYGPQIFMNKNKDFGGLYKYTKGTWSIAPTQLDAQINDVLTGKKMYSKTGVIEGDGSIFDNMNLSDLVAYKTNTNNYEKGIYVKGNIAEIESPGVVAKENHETLNLLTKSIYMLKPQEIPEQYASLFVEDASFDNNGVHTIYLDGMIVKDRETGYAQHTVTIFSPDYKTVILDTTTINYNLQTYTRSSDPDVLNWYGYGCGGTLNIKTGEIKQLASTPSAGYYYGRSCIVDGTTLYFANQTGLYKNGTKIATLSMVDSSGSWGYICQHLNGYIYVIPISGSQRQYAKIKLSDNSVTYYDDTLELTGYIQYLDGDVTDKLYFTADSKIYSLDENGWELLDIPEIPSGFFTTPVKYGYIPTVRVKIINDTLTFISLVKGKMIYGTEVRDLYAYGASALNFWSSASISPILLDDTTIYAYELSNGVFRQFKTEPTLTEGTDEIYRLVSTGVTNENIVISNAISF